MSTSNTLYQPSLLDLAREGNCQALNYWLSSLLEPQGIRIRVQSSRMGILNVIVDVRREPVRSRLIRFICYHIWLLNSAVIERVRIVVRDTTQQEILWHQFVRIKTPANHRSSTHAASVRLLPGSSTPSSRFRVLRSLFLNQFSALALVIVYCLALANTINREAGNPAIAAGDAISFVSAADSTQELPRATSAAIAELKDYAEAQTRHLIPDEYQGQIVRSVPAANGEKVVALTFDDGPWEGTTAQVLDILHQHDIKATFFWVGQHLQQHPHLAKQIAEAGHAFGNHSWSHLMHPANPQTAAEEIERTSELIHELTGEKPLLFRPPGGYLDTGLSEYAQQHDHAIAMWSVDSEDYYVPAPVLTDNVLRQVNPGGIVLLHDGGGDRSATVQSLPQIITTLKQRGYKFVTLPELLKQAVNQMIPTPPTVPGSSPSPLHPSAPPTVIDDAAPLSIPDLPRF